MAVKSTRSIGKLVDGALCEVVGGTHAGKSGSVTDIQSSKTGHVTITVVLGNGVRFKTLAKNVVVTARKPSASKIDGNAAAEARLRTLHARFDPKQQRLIRSIRAAVRKRLPTANELAYDYSRFFVIAYSPTDRGIDGIVSIAARADGVDLYFGHGPQLPDPKKLLSGSGKMTRFIRLGAAGMVAHPDVEALIAAAIDHAKVPLPAKGKGKLIIKTGKAGHRGDEMHRIFKMPFAKVYPMYVQKAERKKRTKAEVDRIICWLTGYTAAGLKQQIEKETDFETFFGKAPRLHPNASLIKGVVCGVRVEEVEDPLMRKIRYLDKLIDELAKGKSMDKILRQ